MLLCVSLLNRLCDCLARKCLPEQINLALRLSRGGGRDQKFQAMISAREAHSDQPLQYKFDAALTDQSKGMRLQLRNASRACTSTSTVIPIQQQIINIKPHVAAPHPRSRSEWVPARA